MYIIYRYRAVCRYISSHHVAHIITWVKYIILSTWVPKGTEKGSSPDLSEERLPPNSSCCIELDQWAENMCTSAIIHITHTSQYTYICGSLHWKALKTTMLRRTRVCDPESVQSMYCNHRVTKSTERGGIYKWAPVLSVNINQHSSRTTSMEPLIGDLTGVKSFGDFLFKI